MNKNLLAVVLLALASQASATVLGCGVGTARCANNTGTGVSTSNYNSSFTSSAASAAASANSMSSSGGNTLSNNSSSGGNTQSNAGNNSTNNLSSGGNTQSATQTNTGNNSSNAANGNSVTVNGDTVTYKAQDRNPVSTAYAAPLTASNGTCMGSTSGGIQGIGLGISVGSTWTDSSCDMRYDAEALRAAGLPGAAQARLCQKPEIAVAMEDAGTPCPKSDKGVYKTTYDSNSTKSSGVVNNSVETYTDPIIRQRLGLPPL